MTDVTPELPAPWWARDLHGETEVIEFSKYKELFDRLSAAKAELELTGKMYAALRESYARLWEKNQAAASQARADAIEECAKVCEAAATKVLKEKVRFGASWTQLDFAEANTEHHAFKYAAMAIRALKGVADAQGAGE